MGDSGNVLVADIEGGHTISCILRWPHYWGGQAHCLARAVVTGPPEVPVAVLSELASNPDLLGISADFPAAATAFLTVLSAHAAVDPQEVRWLAQHGHYSSYDPTGGETLTEVTMAFDGHHYHGNLRGHRLLHLEETAQLLKHLNLAPVPDVLLQLGHTDKKGPAIW
ncbi:hypothetical protein [Actinoallomurus sp. CA-150999]|uniref:hypothetical protein n=1 Tax=Actinoallomurus sp. CA-150999 TaxID=3239887 RepID=UPI003D8B14B5